MNPHRLCWGFASTFPFAEIVGLTTLGAFLFSKEPKKIPWTRESVLLLVLVLWMIFTTLFAVHRQLAFLELEKVLKIQLMVFVTLMLMGKRERIDQLVWVMAFSLGFYGVKGGIFTVLTGGAYHVNGPNGTFIGGNNELGLALIMTLPLMRYLQLRAKQKWAKIAWSVSMGLTAIAILGTQSRGAMLGIACMSLFLIWKSRQRFAVLTMLVVIVPLSLSLMPQSWYNRMGTIETYKHDRSAEGRLASWHYALGLAKKSPIVGAGMEAFAGRLDVHSIYFEMIGEHGWVGFGLFILLGWWTWRAGTWVRRRTKGITELRWAADLTSMIQVSLVGYATSGAFLGLAYFDYYYGMIAVVVLCKVQVREFLKQEEKTDERRLEQAPQGSLLDQIEHAGGYHRDADSGSETPKLT